MKSILVVGNPENRRVTGFVEAARAAAAPVRVVAWRQVIAEPRALLSEGAVPLILRLDSWGEDLEVERAFLRRGLLFEAELGEAERLSAQEIDAATAERGRIAAPRQQHLGALAVLAEIDRVLLERPAWRCAQPIAAIRTLFDKRATHELCRSLGLRVPHALPVAKTADELLATMAREAIERAYVKVSCSSSASCLALVERNRQGTSIVTSVEVQGERLYNSLTVRRYARPALVERVLGFLLREGAIVERAVDKTPSGNRYADVRLLFVRGVAPFAVLRESRVPITNLHLGGQRGDVEVYRQKLPNSSWSEALQLGAQLAAAVGTWHLGVDVAFERDSGTPFLLEGNAFGDLLPGIERDGRSIFRWEIESIAQPA